MDDIKRFEPLWECWYIKELIGEGGFGKVYRIEREDYGETYVSALKHIRVPQNSGELESLAADGMDDASITAYLEGFVENIVGEFAFMSKLRGNSNIVSYEDHKVVKAEDKPQWDIFIRMELLTSLVKYIKNNELTKQLIIKLGIDICKALEVCQKHNIIHRDIKPENIFVSEMGDFKLGDFGIARQIEKTMSGLSRKGTFSYIAPEVYNGEAYGSTVDIYSLGMVMYRLLNNNRLPFMPPYPEIITYTAKENSLLRRVSGEPVPMPSGDNGRLAEIVLKACAYEPKDRYDSPSVMRKALEDILYSEAESKVIYPEGDTVDINSVHYVSTSKEKSDISDATYACNQMVSKFYEENDNIEPQPKSEPKSDEPTPTSPQEDNTDTVEHVTDKKSKYSLLPLFVILFITLFCTLMVYETNVNKFVSVATGYQYIVGLKSSGTVLATGDNSDGQCDVSDWTDIKVIACGWHRAVGLKSDGTVVATGDNDYGEFDVSNWTDIVAIACRSAHTIGLKSDGTVVATGISYYGSCDVSEWTDIVAVACGWDHTVGLKSDGTVVATGYNDDGQCNVSDWTNIEAVACGWTHTIGLKSDGTVVATGENWAGQCNVSDWTDIVAVACGDDHTVGLKSDGTVVATGINDCGQCDVSEWTDIVAVAASYYNTVGLKSDGTIVVVGDNSYGQCDVESWNEQVS